MLHSHVHAFIPFLPTNAPDPICGHCITLCLHINASCILLQDNSYLPKYWTEAANVETYFESTWARESIFMHGYLFQPHPSLHFVPNLSLVLLEAHSNWELAQQIIKAPPPRGCARLGCLLSTFLFRGWYMTTLLGCHPSSYACGLRGWVLTTSLNPLECIWEWNDKGISENLSLYPNATSSEGHTYLPTSNHDGIPCNQVHLVCMYMWIWFNQCGH